MRNKILISMLSAGIIFSSFSSTALASGNEQQEVKTENDTSAQSDEPMEENLQDFNNKSSDSANITMGDIGIKMGVDMDDVFASMKESLKNGESISFSEAINAFTSTPIQTESYTNLSSFGLDSGNTDFGMVNIQYSMLADEMEGTYATTDLTSDSENSIALLNKEYGDVLSGVSLEVGDVSGYNIDMPDYIKGGLELSNGMSISGIMNNANKQINSLYSSAASDSGLNKIHNSINISSVFNEAGNWKSSVGDPSSLTLQGAIASTKSLDQNAKSETMNSYSSGKSSTYKKRNDSVAASNEKNMKDEKKLKSKPYTYKITHPIKTIENFIELNPDGRIAKFADKLSSVKDKFTNWKNNRAKKKANP